MLDVRISPLRIWAGEDEKPVADPEAEHPPSVRAACKFAVRL